MEERRRRREACPDCQPIRLRVLDNLVQSAVGCAFVCRKLCARDTVPFRWYEDFAFAILRRGVIVRQRIDGEGGSVAVDVAGAGCLLPLRADESGAPAHSAYAATDASVCLMTQTALKAHDDGACYRDLHRLENQTLERMERLVDARGRSSAGARVAALICALSDTLSPDRRRESLPPELQRIDMAALLSIRRETFSRALGALVRCGVVRREADGLRILDRSALERASSTPLRQASGTRLRAPTRKSPVSKRDAN